MLLTLFSFFLNFLDEIHKKSKWNYYLDDEKGNCSTETSITLKKELTKAENSVSIASTINKKSKWSRYLEDQKDDAPLGATSIILRRRQSKENWSESTGLEKIGNENGDRISDRPLQGVLKSKLNSTTEITNASKIFNLCSAGNDEIDSILEF